MKLLILTQAVDRDDPILGFFVRWIEEFAKHADLVTVVCLREGKHALPENVRVQSLGKEHGGSRFSYTLNFYRAIVRYRRDYDAVFVHMNPEYVVLGGPLWRILGKRIALWYTHKSVDLKLRIATLFADVIFTASKESFRLRSGKVRVMGHGIDTDFFSPDPSIVRTEAILSAGRLSKAKRHDLVLEAAALLPNPVRVVGDGPERQALAALAEDLGIADRVRFLGSRDQTGLRDEYRCARVFAHASETGSLDKVVLEALACGLPVVSTNTALSGLPVVRVAAAPEALAEGIHSVSGNNPEVLAEYVQRHHSLTALVPRLISALS